MSTVSPLHVRDNHCTSAVMQTAEGGLVAQAVLDGLRDGILTPDAAWLKFIELGAKFGRHSPASRAFMMQILKQVAPQ